MRPTDTTAIEALRDDMGSILWLLHLEHEAIVALDEGHRIFLFNQGAERLFGVAAEQAQGRSLDGLLPSRVLNALQAELDLPAMPARSRMLNENGPATVLRRGVEVPVDGSLSRFRFAGVDTTVLVLRDATAAVQREERWRYLAQHDHLTGLPNRAPLMDRLATAIARARRGRHKLAVLFVDLDDFKAVNDHNGHLIGDRLLQEAAGRLSACVRESDTVARLAGDEFVLVLEEVRGRADAARVVDEILRALARPVVIDGQLLRTRTSIGTALYPDDASDPTALLDHADRAMYASRRGRRRPPAAPAPAPA
jgi:diguanylate cyclase (GGDEF)-like protein/PAS domain S-box-containing protein